MAEPLTPVSALDEARHVGDDEAAVVGERDDAEIWGQRRERIVGNLRARRGDAGDQRRLAGVGISDETRVGNQLQLQTKDRKSTRLNSSHLGISYAVFCLK